MYFHLVAGFRIELLQFPIAYSSRCSFTAFAQLAVFNREHTLLSAEPHIIPCGTEIALRHTQYRNWILIKNTKKLFLDKIVLRLNIRWQLQLTCGDSMAFRHFLLSIQSTKCKSLTEIQVLKECTY